MTPADLLRTPVDPTRTQSAVRTCDASVHVSINRVCLKATTEPPLLQNLQRWRLLPPAPPGAAEPLWAALVAGRPSAASKSAEPLNWS